MNYTEVENFLFNSFADFQKYGQAALIYDLSNIIRLCEALGNPQEKFRSIHVAGTNGKGSSSHMLASIMQEAGHKTGLYTSPHLKKFAERIKINGMEIPETSITDFVTTHYDLISAQKYSFFEITTVMAFDFFAKEKVDVAIVEVGLGGRLDATNIISPILSLITNIGFDHVGILGDSLAKIAYEKAGIIKENTPVVISEYSEETQPIFMSKANALDADIFFASKMFDIEHTGSTYTCTDKISKLTFEVILDLKGHYQAKNLLGVLATIKILNELNWKIKPEHLLDGLAHVKRNTGLKGRWQILHQKPLVICDTAHNEAGIQALIHQCTSLSRPLHLLVNFTKEKELSKIIALLPENATFHTCDVKNPRMRTAAEIKKAFASVGLYATTYLDVNTAIEHLTKTIPDSDALIVFGSNFLIAEISAL